MPSFTRPGSVRKHACQSFIRSFVGRSFVRRIVRNYIKNLIDKFYKVFSGAFNMCFRNRFPAGENHFYGFYPEIVFQMVKIMSADSIPELVFQQVRITSTDSTSQLSLTVGCPPTSLWRWPAAVDGSSQTRTIEIGQDQYFWLLGTESNPFLVVNSCLDALLVAFLSERQSSDSGPAQARAPPAPWRVYVKPRRRLNDPHLAAAAETSQT